VGVRLDPLGRYVFPAQATAHTEAADQAEAVQLA
jgi:hypothetical protein